MTRGSREQPHLVFSLFRNFKGNEVIFRVSRGEKKASEVGEFFQLISCENSPPIPRIPTKLRSKRALLKLGGLWGAAMGTPLPLPRREGFHFKNVRASALPERKVTK